MLRENFQYLRKRIEIQKIYNLQRLEIMLAIKVFNSMDLINKQWISKITVPQEEEVEDLILDRY